MRFCEIVFSLSLNSRIDYVSCRPRGSSNYEIRSRDGTRRSDIQTVHQERCTRTRSSTRVSLSDPESTQLEIEVYPWINCLFAYRRLVLPLTR